jgi:hypothetical protein
MAGLSWHTKTSKIVRFEDEAVRIWYGQDSFIAERMRLAIEPSYELGIIYKAYF